MGRVSCMETKAHLEIVFMLQFDDFSKKIKKIAHQKNCQIAAVLIFCLCGNRISVWGVMRKSDFFSLVQRRFHDFFENVWKFVNGRRLY